MVVGTSFEPISAAAPVGVTQRNAPVVLSARQMVYGVQAPEPSAAPCTPNLPNTGSGGGNKMPNVPLILLLIIAAAAVVSRLLLRLEILR